MVAASPSGSSGARAPSASTPCTASAGGSARCAPCLVRLLHVSGHMSSCQFGRAEDALAPKSSKLRAGHRRFEANELGR
eukprot:11903273-Alexandrium_andersonii.AAC.1